MFHCDLYSLSEDMEYLELRAMRVEILGDLTRLEERIAEVREGVEHATAMARRSDLLLDEVRSQAEAELFEIGEEVKKMYVVCSCVCSF